MSLYASFNNIDVFRNISDHEDSDGFFLFTSSQVNVFRDEDKKASYLAVIDPDGASEALRLSFSMISKYDLKKIKSKRENHQMGRLTFDYPMSNTTVKSIMGLKMKSIKYTLKMRRDDYYDFREAFVGSLSPQEDTVGYVSSGELSNARK